MARSSWFPVRIALLGAALVARAPAPLAAQHFAPSLAGTVRDSLSGLPLPGARVELLRAGARESAGYLAEADGAGRYRIDSIAPGRYMLGFSHPRLDSLGLSLMPRFVEITTVSDVSRADLALPSARVLGDVLCGIQRDATGALFGRVLDADAGAPVSEGTVLIRWGDIHVDSAGVQRILRGVRARVGTGGRYAACGIPTGVAVLVQARALASLPSGVIVAASGADSIGRASIVESASDGIEITLDPLDPVRFRDLFVPSSSLLRDAARDSVASSGDAAARAIASRLVGRVFRPDGRPLEGARIRVGSSRQQEAVSDAAGFYLLDAVASGTQTVEVIAIGYTPIRSDVDLRPSAPVTYDARFEKAVPTLDAVSVYSAPARANSEFARRRGQGFGEFLTGDEIMRRTSTYLANALAGTGGLRIIGTNQIGQPLIGGRSNCVPGVFLDGFRLPEGVNGLDRWVRPAEIGGIEVYADGVNSPPQYSSLATLNESWFSDTGAVNLVPRAGAFGAAGCGVILVWTKQAIW